MKLLILALLILSVPGAAVAVAQPISVGSWTGETQRDPFTDADDSIIYTTDPTATATGLLGFRCMADGLNVIFMPNRYLGSSGPIQTIYRFDQDPPSETRGWGMLTNNTAVWMPLDEIASFTERALNATTVAFRVTSYSGLQYTNTFTLTGLEEALAGVTCATQSEQNG